MKVLLHVDMDAFFASVELTRHPEWRGRPLIVGAGPHERGVVSTCSYEARRYGIHSAMPSRTAYQLCPTAIFVPPDGALYEEVSRRVFEIFEHYSPIVEGVSIDEAFLDVTGTLHLYGDGTARGDGPDLAAARRLGEALRAEVRRVCGVTCSVGIAPNRLLAKIGSELHKPDGLTVMPFDAESAARLLSPRPLGIIWGIGRKTEEALRPYGLTTCGDLQHLPVERLAALVGGLDTARHLREEAFGLADDTVCAEPAAEQSVSREHTFPEDATDRSIVRAQLLELVAEVGLAFRRERRWARTARIKLRDDRFRTILRQMPFPHPSRDDIAFRAAALELFDRERISSVRLVGFGVTNLVDSPDEAAPSLFESTEDRQRERHERLSETLDALREKGLMR